MNSADNIKPVKGKRVIKNLIAVMVALLFLLVLLMTIFKIQNPNESTFFGIKPIIIETGSMEPTIKTNALVLGSEVQFKDLKQGDIITYEMPDGKLNTHRITGKAEETDLLYTKGDNTVNPDTLSVTPENYKYKIIYICNWFSKLNTAKGILLYIVLPVILFIVFVGGMIMIFASVRKKRAKRMVDCIPVTVLPEMPSEHPKSEVKQGGVTSIPEQFKIKPPEEKEETPIAVPLANQDSPNGYLNASERQTVSQKAEAVSGEKRKGAPEMQMHQEQKPSSQQARCEHVQKQKANIDISDINLSDIPLSTPDWRDEILKDIAVSDIELEYMDSKVTEGQDESFDDIELSDFLDLLAEIERSSEK